MIVMLTISGKSWMFYGQEHSTLLRNGQQSYHGHKSATTFNSSQKLPTELSYTQIVELNVLDDLFIREFYL
jgi:hypothetical protein